MDDDTLHIFMHIPKTGGTTLTGVLRQHYALAKRFDHDSHGFRPMSLTDLPDEIKSGIRCLMGHYYYGVHHQFPGRRFAYFTMLRDPVERVLSHYSFVQTYPGYEFVHGKSFGEYLDLAAEASNAQTLQVSGSDSSEAFNPRRMPDIERAKANLAAFAAVGVTELFAESLAVFAHAFSWPEVHYETTNVTVNRLHRDDLSAADLRKAEERNALDLELHAFARTLLLQRLADQKAASMHPG